MPNYCLNLVEFKCPDLESLDELRISALKGRPFNEYVPLENARSPLDAIEAWGTKWEPSELRILGSDRNNFILLVFFYTAWTPPHTFLNRLRNDYNIVSYCFFYEPDTNLCGMIRENGDVLAVDADDVSDVFPESALELLGLATYRQQFISENSDNA